MQHIVWLETAQQDLDKILGYIEDRNLLAALNLHESIEHAVSQLPFHPYLYIPLPIRNVKQSGEPFVFL